MLTANGRSRVEPELKPDAEAVLKAAGLDVSTAIRLFLRSVVETGGIAYGDATPDGRDHRRD
jgi:DNA-damage-inducible protein J